MIGRKAEITELRRAYESDQSEFVAVYGRRRIGKTFLVDEAYAGLVAFRHAGVDGVTKREQLEAFWEALKKQGGVKGRRPTSWIRAFSLLGDVIESLPPGRKVIFLDELPWFDTPKSGFLKAFEWFWNSWACPRKDIVLVICGSATSWIVKKVLRNRGGLHNRVTVQLPLAPFTLAECEEYAAYKGLSFDRGQILECYMAFGGVAYYWSLLREGLSAAQNIDRLCFGPLDEMRNEFNNLFASLFKMETKHVSIVRALGKRRSGLTRDEIVAAIDGVSGGGVSECLKELEDCGFIRHYNILGQKKKGAIYQLIDNYVLFYFSFLSEREGDDPEYWMHHAISPKLFNWRGLAFEQVCFWHIPQIKRALGISGIAADTYSLRIADNQAESRPVQIDMLISRADGTLSVCEIKHSSGEYDLTADEYGKINRRANAVSAAFEHRKAIQKVLISPFGVKSGKYKGNIHRFISLDDLFA